jgi:hypothetical protein
VEHRGPGSKLTRARKVAEWQRIGGEGGGRKNSSVGRSGIKNGARRSGGGAVGGGDAGAPFYRVRGGAGWLSIRGESVAAVVHHNGGGGGRFRRGSSGVVVGSYEGGGCSGRYGSERGTGRWRVRMRGSNGSCGRWSGEEDNQARPTCQRAGAVCWLGQPTG